MIGAGETVIVDPVPNEIGLRSAHVRRETLGQNERRSVKSATKTFSKRREGLNRLQYVGPDEGRIPLSYLSVILDEGRKLAVRYFWLKRAVAQEVGVHFSPPSRSIGFSPSEAR